jgi:O-antigen ligase
MVTDATNVFFFWVGVFSVTVFVALAIKFTLREAILYGLVFLTNSAFTDSAFLPRLPFGGGNLFLSDAYLLAAVLLVFLSGRRTGDLLPGHYRKCFLVFGGTILIAALIGLSRGADPHYVLRELHYLPYYPLTMILVLHAVRSLEEQDRLLKFVTALVVVSAMGSFLQLAVADHFQFMSYADPAFNLEGEQTGALRVRPPSQWLFLVFLVGALGTYPLWRRRRGLMLAALTSVLLALFLGYSRNYFLALAVGVTVIVFLRKKGWKSRIRHAALAVTVGSVAFLILSLAVRKMAPDYWSAFEDRIISSVTPAESDALWEFGSRLYEIEMATGHIRQHPILGLGVGTTYRDILPFEYRQADISENPDDAMHYMHNVYLYIWMKYGLIGALAGGWIVLLFLKRAWPLARSDAREAVLFTGIVASFLALAASNLVSPSFVDSAAAPTLVGLMAGLVELGHQRLAHSVPRPGPRAFGRQARPIVKPVDPEFGLTA